MRSATFVPRQILSLKTSISEARTLIKGTKRVFLAYALTFLIPLTLLENTFLLNSPDFTLTFNQQLLVNITSWILQTFLALGLATAGLARARGEEIRYDYLWRGHQYLVPLALYLLVQLAVAQLNTAFPILGGLIAFVSGLYLMFTALFIVDRGMNPLDAMSASAKSFHANLGPLLLYMLLGVALLIGCVLTVGILTLWVLPFIAILLAVLYLEIAGPPPTPTSKTLTFERAS